MDRYPANRPDPRSRCQRIPVNQMTRSCRPQSANQFCPQDSIYRHIDQMPPAMAYVPIQEFHTTFELCKALKMGTLFPELCKPFCGKRGVRR